MMKREQLHVIVAAGAMLMALTACDGTKFTEQLTGTFMTVTQKGGPTLGYSPSSGVKILTVANLPIVPNEDGTLAAVETGLMGGWAYAEDPTVTEEMAAKLEKALEKNLGATYVPVANLGTQVVAGLNRCLLCQVTPVSPNGTPHYALIYVYEDLQGGATLTQVIDLDVGAYCTYGA